MKVKFINGEVVDYPQAAWVRYPNSEQPYYILRTKADGDWVATLTAANVMAVSDKAYDQPPHQYKPSRTTIPPQPAGDKGAWWDIFGEQFRAGFVAKNRIKNISRMFRGIVPNETIIDEDGKQAPAPFPYLFRPSVVAIDGKLPEFYEWCKVVAAGGKDAELRGIPNIGEVTLAAIKERALMLLENRVIQP